MATAKASISRPAANEYLPYYERYISFVPDGDILDTLAQQVEATLKLLRTIDDSRANHRYEPGKWSIKELLGHIIDSERIFNDRALRFARNDHTPLPGFEQDDYVREANFDARSWADLTEELSAVRRATIHFFKSLDEKAWSRRGVANDAEVSVRALAYIIAGHEIHHVKVLQSRYLS